MSLLIIFPWSVLNVHIEKYPCCLPMYLEPRWEWGAYSINSLHSSLKVRLHSLIFQTYSSLHYIHFAFHNYGLPPGFYYFEILSSSSVLGISGLRHLTKDNHLRVSQWYQGQGPSLGEVRPSHQAIPYHFGKQSILWKCREHCGILSPAALSSLK